MLTELEQIIKNRRDNPRTESYTNALFEKGRNKIAQKVGEEGVEVVIAALGQGRTEQIAEIADLMYHLLVLMNDLDLRLEDINTELRKRHTPEE